MNLTLMRANIRYRLNQRDDLTTGDGLVAINSWVNAAYREICHSFRFTELETENTSLSTTTNQRYVSLSSISDLYTILSVYDVTNSLLLTAFEGGITEFENQSTTQGSRPTKYLHFSNRLYLIPTPGGVYNLRLQLYNEPAGLVNDTDSPVLPEVWHDAIQMIAVRNGWRAIGDEQKAQLIETVEYPAFLQRVRTPRAAAANVPKRRYARVRGFMNRPDQGV